MKAANGARRRQARPATDHGRPSPWAWAGLGQAATHALLVLLAVILLTGLARVGLTQQHRQMSRLLHEQREGVALEEEERGRLQLEISTFALPDRIERVAREELGMHVPEPEDIVVVHND